MVAYGVVLLSIRDSSMAEHILNAISQYTAQYKKAVKQHLLHGPFHGPQSLVT